MLGLGLGINRLPLIGGNFVPVGYKAFIVTDDGGIQFVVTDNGGSDFNVK